MTNFKMRMHMALLKIKCTLNPDGMVRKYLQEWRDENTYAEENCQKPDFSWHWHDKELISIQGAIRHTYELACARKRTSLTEEEKAEIEKILSCVID